MSTIIQQGSFTSTGASTIISVRSDIDFFKTTNFTQNGLQQTPGRAIVSEWFRGMADGSGLATQKGTGVDSLVSNNFPVPFGFTLINTSVQTLQPALALTAISNAIPPLVTTASTASLVDNDVVRIFNTAGAQQLGGYDFSVDVTSATTFALQFMGQIIAGTAGTFAKVNADPKFFPRRRFITGISLGTSTVIALSVTHDFTVGEEIRLNIPAQFGAQQLNGLSGTITAVAFNFAGFINTITLDINSTGFAAFVFPLTAAVPFTPAQVIPVGEAAIESVANSLSGATLNTALIGMQLAAGPLSPAGSIGDLIFWQAGKSFSVTNI